jgi:hypothetical protein
MAAKLTRLIHKIPIQLHLVREGCTICSSRSRRKFLDTPSYILCVCVCVCVREIYNIYCIVWLGLVLVTTEFHRVYLLCLWR